MKSDNPQFSLKQSILPMVSLFSSMGTLLCCALPALLVTIGAGATLAGIVADAPWLITLSKYKSWTFGISGLLLLISGLLLWQARKLPCPADEKQALACARLRRFSVIIYYASVLIWLTGFFFAFLAVHIFY